MLPIATLQIYKLPLSSSLRYEKCNVLVYILSVSLVEEMLILLLFSSSTAVSLVVIHTISTVLVRPLFTVVTSHLSDNSLPTVRLLGTLILKLGVGTVRHT